MKDRAAVAVSLFFFFLVLGQTLCFRYVCMCEIEREGERDPSICQTMAANNDNDGHGYSIKDTRESSMHVLYAAVWEECV